MRQLHDRARRGSLLAVAAVIACLGCGDDDDVLTVVPPLVIRGSTPAQEELGQFVTGFTGIQDLSVDFDRPVGAGQVTMELYPVPVSAGAYGPTGSGRNWAWFDVECRAVDGGYAWLIDAALMVAPEVIHFGSGDRNPLDGFSGAIYSTDFAQARPEGTVVFVLPADAPFTPLDPASFLEIEPLAVSASVAIDRNPTVDGPAEFETFFLETQRGYLVIAVQDTNGDLRYDPTADWWGFHRAANGETPELAFAYTRQSNEYNEDVTIFLRAPSGRADARGPDGSEEHP